MKLKNILIVIALVAMLVLTSCGDTKFICPSGKQVDGPEDCPQEAGSDNPEAINNLDQNIIASDGSVKDSDILSYFSTDDFEYTARSSTPKDSIIKNKYTKRFNSYVGLTYSFANKDLLIKSPIYLKIVNLQDDSNLNKVVYAGPVSYGSENVEFALELQYIHFSPKVMFCFDSNPQFDPESPKAACIKKSFISPEIETDLSMTSIRFNFDTNSNGATLEDVKKTVLKNVGIVPQTFYIFPEKYMDVDVSSNFEKVFLEVGEEVELAITAKFIDDGFYKEGLSLVHIYSVEEECDVSLECSKSASYKSTLTVQFKY